MEINFEVSLSRTIIFWSFLFKSWSLDGLEPTIAVVKFYSKLHESVDNFMLDFSFLIVPLSFSHVSESWEVERRTRYVAQHLICFPQNLIRHHSGAAAREERRKRRRRLALWCVWVDAVGESRWKSENYCHELHILEWWTTNTFFVLLQSTSRFCTQISYFFNFAFYVQKIKNSFAKNNKISCIGRRSTPVSYTKIVFCEKFKFKARDSASADAVQTPEQSKCHQLPTVSLTKLTTATTTFALISPSKSKYETPNCPFSPWLLSAGRKNRKWKSCLSDTECQKLLRLHSKTFINFFVLY